MEILGLILLVVGGIIAFVGGIMFLIVAFKESVLWGLACIFIPFASLVFLFMNWAKAKQSFFIQLGGAALLFLGIMLGGKVGG